MNAVLNTDKLDYEIIGDGLPIVFLHGYGMDCTYLKAFFEKLDLKYFQRIYLELPSANKATGLNVESSDEILRLVNNTLNILCLSEKITIVSHSYGSYIAEALISLQPEKFKSHLMLAPVVVPEKNKRSLPLKKTFKEYGFCHEGSDDDKIFDEIFVRQNPSTYSDFKKFFLKSTIKNYRNPSFSDSKGYILNIKFDLNNINKTVICGENDSIVGFEDQLRLYANNVIKIPNTGHYFFFEEQSQVGQIIENWLLDTILINEKKSISWDSILKEYEVPTICKSSLILPIIQDYNFVSPILDAGCGTGIFSELLSKKGHNLTAIDISDFYFKRSTMVEYFKLSVFDVSSLGKKFETILLINVLATLDNQFDRTKLLDELNKVLSDDGRIYVFFPYVKDLNVENDIYRLSLIGTKAIISYKKVDDTWISFQDNVVSYESFLTSVKDSGFDVELSQILSLEESRTPVYWHFVLRKKCNAK